MYREIDEKPPEYDNNTLEKDIGVVHSLGGVTDIEEEDIPPTDEEWKNVRIDF